MREWVAACCKDGVSECHCWAASARCLSWVRTGLVGSGSHGYGRCFPRDPCSLLPASPRGFLARWPWGSAVIPEHGPGSTAAGASFDFVALFFLYGQILQPKRLNCISPNCDWSCSLKQLTWLLLFNRSKWLLESRMFRALHTVLNSGQILSGMWLQVYRVDCSWVRRAEFTWEPSPRLQGQRFPLHSENLTNVKYRMSEEKGKPVELKGFHFGNF